MDRRWTVRMLLGFTAAGVAVALLDLQPRALLLFTIAVATLIPLAIKVAAGTLDPLEPLVMTSAAFMILFVARPLYDVLRGDPSYLDYNVDETYDLALAAAATAVVAFQVGYAWAPPPRSLSDGLGRLVGVGRQRRDSVLFGSAVILSALGAGAAISSAMLSGGADLLIQGRGAIDAGATNVPLLAVGVSLVVPGFFLFWCVEGKARPLARVLSLVPLAFLSITAIPKGDRRLILPLIVGIGTYFYLRANRRPTPWKILVTVAAVFFLVVTPLREFRSSPVSLGNAVADAIQNPGAAAEDLLLSQDTAHVSVLALLISQVGDNQAIPWQMGAATLTETLLQPVPRQLWPDKPVPIRTQFIELNWGMAGGRCISQCPTLSVIGTLFADFGLLSVALGCFALGWFARVWYFLMMSMRNDNIMIAAYSGTLFTFFLVWWSSLATIVIDFALYAVPVIIVGVAARSPSRDLVRGVARAPRTGTSVSRSRNAT